MKVKMKKKARRKLYRLFALIFLGILLTYMLLNLISRDKEYSEQEDRMLTQRPKLSMDNIVTRKYMKEYEAYQADQFVGRDGWTAIKTKTDFLLGKRDSNQVFYGKGGYLLEDIVSDEGENTKHNIESIKNFADRNEKSDIYFMLVPNAANVWADRLPKSAPVKNQTAQMAGVKKKLENKVTWIDVEAALRKHAKEELYYHTDHHWTSLAAGYAFDEAASVMELDKKAGTVLQGYVVTNEFNGTLSAKSGYLRKYKEPITAFLPNGETFTKVLVQDSEGRKKATLYDSEKLKGKDKYALFMGGDFPLLDIKTTSSSERKLLLLKDSYANCFIPFLVSYYQEIVVVDPRYYYEDMGKLLEKNGFTDILFLYNANTFFADNNISGVLDGK